MMHNQDHSTALQDRIKSCLASKTTINITAGNSKNFYGRTPRGEPLSVAAHSGIVHYEPTELVITARCGTPISEIEQVLNEYNQVLGFEPPRFGSNATLGGCVASGLSGPARPYRGALRDFVLGTTIINGRGEILHFGGEVMKNVAGYDVSRLMVGAMGTLGVLLDVSIRVLPRPEHALTLSFELAEQAAIERMNEYAAQPLPISAACFDGDRLHIRLSGNESGVSAAKTLLGGEQCNESIWQKLREQTHNFFKSDLPLWRCAVAPASAPLPFDGKQFIDWGGAQRWLLTQEPAETIFNKTAKLGGHATTFRNGERDAVIFQPLTGKLLEIHQRIKQSLDPMQLFNPGRLYPEF